MPLVRTGADVAALFAHLAGLPREVVGIGYLDVAWRLVAVRHCVAGGGPDAAELSLATVARDAVRLRAARVVMAHNHPSGDPTPSRADLVATARLARALDALGAPLVEHLVLARGGRTSLGAAGFV